MFWLAALNPDNRFRYPPVTLFFDMWWWLRSARGFWENLFDIEFQAQGRFVSATIACFANVGMAKFSPDRRLLESWP